MPPKSGKKNRKKCKKKSDKKNGDEAKPLSSSGYLRFLGVGWRCAFLREEDFGAVRNGEDTAEENFWVGAKMDKGFHWMFRKLSL